FADANGNFTTQLQLSTKAGYHSLHLHPVAMPVADKPYYVRTVADDPPVIVTSDLEIAEGGIGSAQGYPYPYIVADGFSKFFITYTLYDKYNNPVSNRVLKFNSTIP